MARILVVDDDGQFLRMVDQMLQREGHIVHVASHGAAGLLCLKRDSFDLAIVDVFMPRRDGLEVITEIRQDHPQLPVIAISGGMIPGDATGITSGVLSVAEQTFGAPRVLRKPLRRQTLIATIDELLGKTPDNGDR